MRAFLLISCAALGLAACSRDEAAEDANMADANLTMEENMVMDNAMNGDINMADDTTANLVNQDMQSNEADANLANGL